MDKKIVTLYLPFVVSESLYTFWKVWTGQLALSFWDGIGACLGIRLTNSVLWYVPHLMMLEMVFYFYNHFRKRNGSGVKSIWKFWCLCYAVYLIIAIVNDVGNWLYISSSAWIIGFALSDADIKIRIVNIFNRKVVKMFSCICFGAVYILIMIFSFKDISNVGWMPINYFITLMDMLLVPLFLCFAANVTIHLRRHCKVLDLLGCFSYEIYLYHILVRDILQYVWDGVGIGICIGCTIVVSYIVYKIRIMLSDRLLYHTV